MTIKAQCPNCENDATLTWLEQDYYGTCDCGAELIGERAGDCDQYTVAVIENP